MVTGSGRYVKVCLVCFREYRTNCKNGKYCPECALIMKEKRNKANQKKRRTARKKAAADALKDMTINQIAAEADKAGMTYGQYVGKMSFRKK